MTQTQRRFPLAFVLGCLLAPPSMAQAQQPPTGWYGQEYQECSRQSTVDIVTCVQQRTAAWERRMNDAYQALSASMSSSPRGDQLHQAQQRWAEYRDANCRFYAAGPGSLSRVTAAECLRVMTASRAWELEQASRH